MAKAGDVKQGKIKRGGGTKFTIEKKHGVKCQKKLKKWYYLQEKVVLPPRKSGITSKKKWYYLQDKVVLPPERPLWGGAA